MITHLAVAKSSIQPPLIKLVNASTRAFGLAVVMSSTVGTPVCHSATSLTHPRELVCWVVAIVAVTMMVGKWSPFVAHTSDRSIVTSLGHT